MDVTSMKALGWSQELIDAINELKTIVERGAVKDPRLSGLDTYNIDQFSSTSINISLFPPVGQTHIKA